MRSYSYFIVYLKIEENTKFAQIESKLNLPSDDEQAELYLYTVELLEQYGYMQYEISNFAKKGFESRHNSSYWECGEYIGIGPSAHSFFNGKRFFYDRSIENFKANKIINDGEGGTAEEYIMLSLRLKRDSIPKNMPKNTVLRCRRVFSKKLICM